jgi:aconitate hydratase
MGCGALSKNSFKSKTTLEVAGKSYEIFDLTGFAEAKDLPFSLKILLENLLRTEDGANITADQIKKLANWNPSAQPDTEIQFTSARVIMQDFTGVPCVVDLATMREAIADLGGDPAKVNPLSPAE